MNKKLLAVVCLFSIAIQAQANRDAEKQAAYAAYRLGEYHQAFELFSKHALEPDSEVHFRLGQMYRNGWGVDKDLTQSAAWYRSASEQGHAPAMYNLAGMYHNGEGVTQDRKVAIQLSTASASLGYTKAAIYLGDIYAKGVGVPQDLRRAYGWYDLAAKERDPVAVINRSAVQRLMSPEDLAAAQNMQLLDKGLQTKYAALQADKLAKEQAVTEALSEPGPPIALMAEPETTPATFSELSPKPVFDQAIAEQPAQAPEPVAVIVAAKPAPVATPAVAAKPVPPAPQVAARVAPAPPPAAAVRYSGVTREVRPGETLFSIARQLKGDSDIGTSDIVAALKGENPELATRELRIGQRIRIPEFAKLNEFAAAEVPAARTPKAVVVASAPQRPAATYSPPPAGQSTGGATVEIRPGDTLFSIAKRLRNNPAIPIASIVSALEASNPWIQGTSLRPGDRLKVPNFNAQAYAGADIRSSGQL